MFFLFLGVTLLLQWLFQKRVIKLGYIIYSHFLGSIYKSVSDRIVDDSKSNYTIPEYDIQVCNNLISQVKEMLMQA